MILGTIASAFQTGSGFTPLLDTYTGAGAAFSLRKLSSSSTNAIRISRDSDSSETDIGFSGENLDEASITSFCSGTTCNVITWYDQSGFGYDIDFDASDAVIYESGSLILGDNSKVGVSIRNYSSPTSVGANHARFLASNQTYMIVAATTDALGSFEAINLGHSVASGTDFTFLGSLGLQNFFDDEAFFAVSDYSVQALAESFPVSGDIIAEGQMVSSGDINVYVDGVDETTSSATGSFSPSQADYEITISFNSNEYILQESIQWPVNQSSNRSDIYTNVSTYWA